MTLLSTKTYLFYLQRAPEEDNDGILSPHRVLPGGISGGNAGGKRVMCDL